MRITSAVAGIALAGCLAGCQPPFATQRAAPAATVTATVTAAPPSGASETPMPTPTPTLSEFVRVPDMAHRRVAVATYLLDQAGLGHTLVGVDPDYYDPGSLTVCASIPRAGTTVRAGTRVALVVTVITCPTYDG